VRRDATTRVTFDPEMERMPVWSPDALRLAYSAVRAGLDTELYETEVGTGGERALLRGEGTQLPRDWSPDSRHLMYTTMSQSNNTDIWLLPMEGKREPLPFAQTPANEVGPRFSPDGRWVAYFSNESGANVVYVKPFPGPGVPLQVALRGTAPAWRGDGRELYYMDGRRIMAVSVSTTSGRFEAGEPRVLFEADLRANFAYDVSRDGQRFVLIVGSGAPPPNNVVTTNWTKLAGSN
jgi:Tol biopolymer transport system component